MYWHLITHVYPFNTCLPSSHVSYKTLKLYLAAIQLEYLEQGLSGPTNDEVLCLVAEALGGCKVR